MTKNYNTDQSENSMTVWRFSPLGIGLLLLTIAALVLSTLDGWRSLLRTWETIEAYSYGYLIPPISIFLLWQRKDLLERVEYRGSWLGLALLIFGFLISAAGKLTSTTTLIQYGFLISLLGVALTVTGSKAFRLVFVPLAFLAFMVPLPGFVFFGLSQKLQLISSELGVAVTRLFGVSVYLEGNVIDLGTYKLQVVEACSGLNYLFPLMALAFITAYFYKAPFWARAIVFLSSIPITILMNSFRIGVIGVLVEYWGPEQAEGFLHFFEGWVIFMACLAILVIEIWLITRLTGDKRPWAEVFGIEFPGATPASAIVRQRTIPNPFIVALLLVGSAAAVALLLTKHESIVPDRKSFSEFPLSIGELRGRSDRIESIYLDQLHLDDYLLVDFVARDQKVVNLYAAYYAAQEPDQAAHSPRTCLPAGGWEVKEFGQRSLPSVPGPEGDLRVNRSVIQKGEYRQLVYYWFQQRGRNITYEYAVKWYLFIDALQRNRSDGALVRLTTPVAPGEDLAAADSRLTNFAKTIMPLLPDYIPN
jgi:exosortase D (VPLPA-CTERM-specific)